MIKFLNYKSDLQTENDGTYPISDMKFLFHCSVFKNMDFQQMLFKVRLPVS